MTNMLDRAIQSAMFHSNTEDMIRAALIAAFDPADDELRNILASYVKDHAPFGSIDNHQARDCATKTITLLQKRVARLNASQGETL